MDKLYKMTMEEIRLDWANNFVSIEGFASHYGISTFWALQIVMLARDVGEEVSANAAA